MSHTPGPWAVESDGTTVSMGDQAVIVSPAPDGSSREVVKANARLIAAVPDLLEAARIGLTYIEATERSLPTLPNIVSKDANIVRDAIAKATAK